jgi:uncharacterized membrane-anchored protein YitT (DUF2179 family)
MQKEAAMTATKTPYRAEQDRLLVEDKPPVFYVTMVGAVIDGTRAGKYGVRIQYVPGDVTDVLGRETKSIKYVTISDLDQSTAKELLKTLRERQVTITDSTGGQFTT